ncbi:hypothetical protein GCM10010156_77150 [Planobispora rosea]|uniref:Anti-sigma regulatory factor (Ser/Thr protein kinase) n=1 Tax=Planobispora rosea TaxID=35762 RepID=A0A8J3SAY1_PLARO|nr:anti-sigma factor RsbA family regulatory protein [Planobispora rosea]GGT08790.1 hypothetical protein GCM10010156_77150 [Planobispora rosea]GIH89241.1 hypothetical protein Pro02_76490 [Planobispora rosea]
MTDNAESYLHYLVRYGSQRELLDTVIPHLRRGLDAGQAVVLVCRDDINRLLSGALGAPVASLGSGELYTRPAAAVAAYRRMVLGYLDDGFERVQVAAEVDFGERPGLGEKGIGFEAVVNVAMDGYPVSGICLYDARTLSDAVSAELTHTHPLVLTPGGPVTNPQYDSPVEVLRRTARAGPPVAEPDPPTYDLPGLTDTAYLQSLRAHLRARLSSDRLPTILKADIIAAIGEVAANGLRHGRAPVRIRIWIRDDCVVCTVTDQGSGFDGLLAGYESPRTGPRQTGTGLWLVRQLCDELATGHTADGFTVRLAVQLRPYHHPVMLHGAHARAEVARTRTERARRRADQIQRELQERWNRQDLRVHRGVRGKPGDRR